MIFCFDCFYYDWFYYDFILPAGLQPPITLPGLKKLASCRPESKRRETRPTNKQRLQAGERGSKREACN